jgi:hypothetical protein
MFALLGVVVASLPMNWIEPPGGAGNARAMVLCVNESGLCRTGAHMVFMATPSGPTNAIVSGGAYSINGGTFIAGTASVFETHVVPPNSLSQLAGAHF